MCTSAAVLRLLRSLTEGSPGKPCEACEQMVLCCGHTLTYDAHGRVLPDGCPNGATFRVEHTRLDGAPAVRISAVDVRLGEKRPVHVEPIVIPLDAYSRQVRACAAAVDDFYERSPARRPVPGCEEAYEDMRRETRQLLRAGA